MRIDPRSKNDISETWLATFLAQRDAEQTVREVAFILSLVPPESRTLDLACGYGRHAALLAARGLHVVGVDRDIRVLPKAKAACPVVQADMRQLPFAPSSFDVVVSLWQSFGYYSTEVNTTQMRRLLEIVRPGGLLILDLYNREFFETASRDRHFERAGVRVREVTTLDGDRLSVHLTYDHTGETDYFEWQVFTPGTLQTMAEAVGWRLAGQYCDFDRSRPAPSGAPRIQYVLSRPVPG